MNYEQVIFMKFLIRKSFIVSNFFYLFSLILPVLLILQGLSTLFSSGFSTLLFVIGLVLLVRYLLLYYSNGSWTPRKIRTVREQIIDDMYNKGTPIEEIKKYPCFYIFT